MRYEQEILESLEKMKAEGILDQLPPNHALANWFRDFSRRFAEIQAQAALTTEILREAQKG